VRIFHGYDRYVYFFKLQVVTDRDQLLNPEIFSNRARQAYRQNFGEDRYLILVVAKLEDSANGEYPVAISLDERQQMKEIASGWTARLSTRPDLFPKTTDRLDSDSFRQLASLYLGAEKLRELSQSLQLHETQIAEWFENPSLQNLLRLINELLEKTASSEHSEHEQQAELVQSESQNESTRGPLIRFRSTIFIVDLESRNVGCPMKPLDRLIG